MSTVQKSCVKSRAKFSEMNLEKENICRIIKLVTTLDPRIIPEKFLSGLNDVSESNICFSSASRVNVRTQYGEYYTN